MVEVLGDPQAFNVAARPSRESGEEKLPLMFALDRQFGEYSRSE
jgi:hypothetical protein